MRVLVGEELFCIDRMQKKSANDRHYPNYLKLKRKILHIVYTEILELR